MRAEKNWTRYEPGPESKRQQAPHNLYGGNAAFAADAERDGARETSAVFHETGNTITALLLALENLISATDAPASSAAAAERITELSLLLRASMEKLSDLIADSAARGRELILRSETMAAPAPRQILVPLKGSDRLEDYLPFLEKSAQAGIQVVFFVHYGVTDFDAVMDQLLAAVSARDTENGFGQGVAATRGGVPAALQTLQDKGVRIEVNLYGLPRTLQEYVSKNSLDCLTPARKRRVDFGPTSRRDKNPTETCCCG